MKIIHRVGFNASQSQKTQLENLGIEYKDLGDDLILFLIEEKHPSWPTVASLIEEWRVPELATTKFTEKERQRASYLVMYPTWHHGYPQPERNFEYKSTTYDATHYCWECVMDRVQQAPFRMLREPKWGSKQILQLNWVFDEYFATPDAWQTVFKPFGIEALPVLHHRTGEPLKTVLQLRNVLWTTGKVNPDGYQVESCSVCQRAKLTGIRTGEFPHVSLPNSAHLGKTSEYFGSGAVAWHEVVVSGVLYRAIAEHKLRGAEFGVIARK